MYVYHGAFTPKNIIINPRPLYEYDNMYVTSKIAQNINHYKIKKAEW